MTLLIFHGLFSFGFLGLIWVIQIVHYPFFRLIDPSRWSVAHRFHQQKMGCIVLPLFIGELVTACWVAFATWHRSPVLNGVNIALICAIWAQTFGVMVPLHRKLLIASNTVLIHQLIAWNWFRTIAWTIRACIAGLFLLTYGSA